MDDIRWVEIKDSHFDPELENVITPIPTLRVWSFKSLLYISDDQASERLTPFHAESQNKDTSTL